MRQVCLQVVPHHCLPSLQVEVAVVVAVVVEVEVEVLPPGG